MNPLDEAPSGARKSSSLRSLQDKFAEIIGADRWVNSSFPALEPISVEETARFFKGYPGVVIVVGSGSSFPADFNPSPETVVLLTRKLRQTLDLSAADQVLEVSAGWLIEEVNQALSQSQFIIPALARFNKGSVGGRLAGVSSRPHYSTQADSWVTCLLSLQVVTPGGEILNIGTRCIKDVAGYDLRHIYTGSRGAIGVIARAAFRCYPAASIKTAKPFLGSVARRFDMQWKRLFDPTGRMHPGA